MEIDVVEQLDRGGSIAVTAPTDAFDWIVYKYDEVAAEKGFHPWIAQANGSHAGGADDPGATIAQDTDGLPLLLRISALTGGPVFVFARGSNPGR